MIAIEWQWYIEKYRRMLGQNISKITFITFFFLLVIHLFLSFIGRTIISTYLLTIALYGLLYFVISFLIRYPVAKLFKNNKHLSSILLGFNILLFLVVAFFLFKDSSLRFGKDGFLYMSYTEKNGNIFYNSGYRFHNLWKKKYDYRPGKPNSKVVEKRAEFTYTYSYNNLGFRNDGEDILKKEKDEYRILALGDSWTEGKGTPDGQTWTLKLEKALLNQYKGKIEVINAGKSGSDPIYQFYTLKSIYKEINPDKIILSINTSDINEIISRGGKERFVKDEKVALKKGPWWEFFYAGSFLVRKYVRSNLKYNRVLIKESEIASEYEKGFTQLYNQIVEFKKYTSDKKIGLTVVFIPGYWDMNSMSQNNVLFEWKLLMNLNLKLKHNKIETVYLPDCYFSKIKNENPRKYWWRKDYHHTPLGYEMMAECLAEHFISQNSFLMQGH